MAKRTGSAAVVVASASAAVLFAAAPPAHAKVILDFDYSLDTNGFFNDPQARLALEEAGRVFSDRIRDSLTEIRSGPLGNWTAEFYHPATGADASVPDLVVPADTLKIYAGGQALGGTTLGEGGPGGYSASAFDPSFFDNLATRGQSGIFRTNPSADTDFAPWGGAITFDTQTTWNFDLATGPTGGRSDFFSVAVHELGHLLGFGTSSSFQNRIDWGNGNFVGSNAVATYGQPVPLGNEAHWANNTRSPMPFGPTQETVMDPGLTVGTRKTFTPLDFAGMADIGWDLAAPGDANADGKVDAADYYLIDQGRALGLLGFRNGDFDGDLSIDATDYLILDRAFMDGLSMLSAAAGDGPPLPASVPEPHAAAATLGLLAAGLLRRRKR